MKKALLVASVVLSLFLSACSSSNNNQQMDPNMDHSKMNMNNSGSTENNTKPSK